MKNTNNINNGYGVHRELDCEEIYEKFRIMHSHLKDVLYMDGYEKLSPEKQNVIETLHGILYMAEHQIIEWFYE